MQDKKHINQGDLSVDRAWEEMLKILDKEMPVETPQRRRVAGAWWWLAAACLVGGVILVALFGQMEQHIPTVNSAPVAIKSQTSGLSAPTALSNDQCLDMTTKKGSGRIKEQIVAPSDVVVAGNNLERLAITTTKNDIATKASSGTIEVSSSSAFQENSQNDLLPEYESGFGHTELTQNTTYQRQVNPINGIKSAVISSKETELPVAVGPYKGRIPLSITASGVSSSPFSPDGFAITLQTEKSLSSKLFLQPEIGYRFQRQALTVQLIDTSASNYVSGVVLNDALDGFSVAEAIAQNTTGNQYNIIDYPTVLKSHIVDAALSIGWRLSDRWQLDAGAEMSYLAMVFEGAPDAGGNNLDFDSSGSPSTPLRSSDSSWYSSKSSDKVDATNFRRLDIGVCAGLTYRVSKHFGIRGQYRQGLFDMLKSQSYSLRNQYLALGGVWTF